MDMLERELVVFYDEFTAQNARVLFALQALVDALANADGADARLTTGAVFWVQWLNDGTLELEQHMRNIRQQAHDTPRSRKNLGV